jgi:undecaprenyl-diphosphatase
VDDLWGQVQDAAWIWVVPVAVATGLTFLGAALAIAGSVPDRLPPLITLEAQVASSFVSRITPASVGGMALNVRFLQKTGVEPAVAVAAVGINAVIGIVVHLTFTLLFFVWAGRQGGVGFGLPSTALILGVVTVALAAAGLLAALPWSRRRLWPVVVRSVRDALRGVGALARQPGKIVLLFGGSALVTASNIAALALALQAFGAGAPVAAVGAVYLAGMAVASAAPVPGGIGAMEAALISGLAAVGVPGEIAIPGVFLYRLITFWLPILPGWLAFARLQRVDAI